MKNWDQELLALVRELAVRFNRPTALLLYSRPPSSAPRPPRKSRQPPPKAKRPARRGR